jgi:tripartite-type tricarboxylate transporter receptor subunit TctC
VATTAEMKKNFTALGIESMTSGSPDEFMKFLQAELTRWGKVAKESGARAD